MFFLIILNVLLNGAFLTVLILTGVGYLNIKYFPLSQGELLTLMVVIITFITLFGITPIGKYLSILILDARKMLPSEQEHLDPILNKITQKIQQNSYKPLSKLNNLKIILSDKKAIEYSIFGTNTIILSTGLVNFLPPNELEAVLVQQIALLISRNGVIWQLFAFSNFITFPISWIAKQLTPEELNILQVIKSVLNKKGIIILLIVFVFLVVILPFIILYILCKKVLELIMYFLNKSYIHKADKCAAQYGYKSDLLSFLEKFTTLEEKSNNLISLLQTKEPSSILRIKKLQLIQ